MEINRKYKEFLTYTKMQPQDQQRFDELVNTYAIALNNNPSKRNVVFTKHDFNHHCVDILSIISNILLHEKGINELYPLELYLLNLAVLFHDISMVFGGYDKKARKITNFDRKKHSQQSAEWLQKEYSNHSSALYIHGELDENKLQILCNICKAHSDVKTGEHGRNNNALLQCKEKTKLIDGAVYERALAGILRLADELDVTVSRLGNGNETDLLDEEDETDAESIKHWQRLQLILNLIIEDPQNLILQINRIRADEWLDRGDAANLKEELYGIQDKIQREIDFFDNNVAVFDDKTSRLVTVRRIKYDINDPNEKKYFEDPEEVDELHAIIELDDPHDAVGLAPTPKTININQPSGQTEKEKDSGTVLLDAVFSERLKNYVLDRNLLHVGHFTLNDNLCARDWIDIEEIVSTKDITSSIVEIIANDLRSNNKDGTYIIVGLDTSGAILAASIAFSIGAPATYVIPARHNSKADVFDIDIPKDVSSKNIIIITDAIVTGLTVRQIIEAMNWQDKVSSIYSIFFRKPSIADISEIEKLRCNIKVLNDSFGIEVSPVKNCPLGPNNCQAINRKNG